VLAVHGDGLHKEQRRVAILNRVLDARATVAVFASLPSAIGFRLAKGLGHDPAYAVAHPEVVDIAVARQADWADRRLRDDPSIGTLIMGHTHRPVLREVIPGHWHLNPGAWLHERRYAMLSASRTELATFG
jgi:UDP-2,3-diacylglucosamine pyrophosphatase LpxH